MRIYRFGIIGVGMITDYHIRAIEALPNAKLEWVCSRNEEKAVSVSRQYNCRGTTEYEEMLADPNVDIICVTTSSGSHAELGLKALQAGKHLLVEKPMAMLTEQATEMIAWARKLGLKLSVISQRRFEPQHQAVHALMESGGLGKLLLVELRCPFFRTQAYYDSADWRGTTTEDGGALMNQGIHSIDLMLWLAGPAHSVMAMTATQLHRMEAEDIGLALVKFDNGTLGSIMTTTNTTPGFPPTLKLFGEKGSIHIEGTRITDWNVPDFPMPIDLPSDNTSGGGAQSPTEISNQYHRLQLKQFIESLQQDTEPAVSGEDGRRTVQLIEAIIQSSLEGREVRTESLLI